MATAQFVHDGKSIDYTPSADVTAGDVVVQEDLVGVAKFDIASGVLGALAVEGVFDFPKATGVGTGNAACETGASPLKATSAKSSPSVQVYSSHASANA